MRECIPKGSNASAQQDKLPDGKSYVGREAERAQKDRNACLPSMPEDITRDKQCDTAMGQRDTQRSVMYSGHRGQRFAGERRTWADGTQEATSSNFCCASSALLRVHLKLKRSECNLCMPDEIAYVRLRAGRRECPRGIAKRHIIQAHVRPRCATQHLCP